MKKAIITALLIATATSSGVGAHVGKVSMSSINYENREFQLAPYEVEVFGNVRLDVLMVVEVRQEGDMWRMTSVDQNGNEWVALEEDGDMFYGDLISVMFDDLGTAIIYDDIITDWRYCGYISDGEAAHWVKR